MQEFDKSDHGRVATKDWHPSACVTLNVEPPKKHSFYGWQAKGPVQPVRPKNEQNRIKEIRRQLRGL